MGRARRILSCARLCDRRTDHVRLHHHDPFGIQAFKLASFSLWPFGRVLVTRPGASRVGSFVDNVLWFIFGGFWTALGHLATALILAITVIGIPFAIAHLKLARVAAWPFGFTIVPASMAAPSDVVVGVGQLGR